MRSCLMRPTPLFLPLTLATTIKVAAQQNPGDQLWVYNTGSSVPVEGSPAVGQDGTIYVVAPGTLSAVTNGGSNKWNFPLDIASHGGYSSPAVASDGTVYVSSGKLYAIKPNGSQKWAYQADSENGSPGIGLDQTVYIHGYHLLHAVSSAGTLLWTNRIGGTYIYGSPSLASGRSIYAPNPETGILYALDPPGTTKWMASGIFGESPAIGVNGTVYLTSGGLYAFPQRELTFGFSARTVFRVLTLPAAPSPYPSPTTEQYTRRASEPAAFTQ